MSRFRCGFAQYDKANGQAIAKLRLMMKTTTNPQSEIRNGGAAIR